MASLNDINNKKIPSRSEEDLNQSVQALYESIELELLSLGYTYQKPSLLAKAILQSSEYFINRQGTSPWQSKDFTAAYIAHFLPMNIFRWLKAFDRMKELKFEDLNNFYDFGAGPLTFKLAHLLKFRKLNIFYTFKEPFPEATQIGQNIYNSLLGKLKLSNKNSTDIQSEKVSTEETLILSYSLNELVEIPKTFWNYKNICILEPSTQKISRQLLEFKESSKLHDFSPIAPCTHCEKCPLYFESKKDWCFDRTHIQIPKLAQELYKLLPFDTSTLTFSYLWISKDKPSYNSNDFRVVGDWQKEKGKKKIMICRSSQREFISLLNRQESFDKNISRGDHESLDFEFELKGNELRIK